MRGWDFLWLLVPSALWLIVLFPAVKKERTLDAEQVPSRGEIPAGQRQEANSGTSQRLLSVERPVSAGLPSPAGRSQLGRGQVTDGVGDPSLPPAEVS
jgi:hypothetical protein